MGTVIFWIIFWILIAAVAFLPLYFIFLFINGLLFVNMKKEYNDDSKYFRFLLNNSTAIAVKLIRIHISLTGREKLPKGRFLLVSNHRSKFDPILTWHVFAKENLSFISKPENFKVYVTDIGLATHQFGFETQSALLRKELKGHAKGGIYENLIFDILHKRGLALNYYKNGENTQEIEFVFERSGEVVPVEVKSRNGLTTSMNEFIKRYSPTLAIKLIDGNVGVDGNKVSLIEAFRDSDYEFHHLYRSYDGQKIWATRYYQSYNPMYSVSRNDIAPKSYHMEGKFRSDEYYAGGNLMELQFNRMNNKALFITAPRCQCVVDIDAQTYSDVTLADGRMTRAEWDYSDNERSLVYMASAWSLYFLLLDMDNADYLFYCSHIWWSTPLGIYHFPATEQLVVAVGDGIYFFDAADIKNGTSASKSE